MKEGRKEGRKEDAWNKKEDGRKGEWKEGWIHGRKEGRKTEGWMDGSID